MTVIDRPYGGLLASPVRLQPSQNPSLRSTAHSGGHRRRSLRFEPFSRRRSGHRVQLTAIGSKSRPVKDSFHRRQSGSHALQSIKALDNHSYFTLPYPSYDLDTPDDYMRSPVSRALQPLHDEKEGRTRCGLQGMHLAQTAYSKLKAPNGRQQDRGGEDVSDLCTPRGRTTRLLIQKETGQSALESEMLPSEHMSCNTSAAMTTFQPHTPGDAWVDRFSSVCRINCNDTNPETGNTPKAFSTRT